MINSVKIGRSVDFILKDYERFLTRSFKHYPPSKQVFHPDVRLELVVPTATQPAICIDGLRRYKAALQVIRACVLTRYCWQQPMLVIDKRFQPSAASLHVQWSLRTRAAGGVRWSGVSEYEFEAGEGRVVKHLVHGISPPPGYWLRFLLYWLNTSNNPTLAAPTTTTLCESNNSKAEG